MRIDEPDYLHTADIVCCPHCKCQLWRVVRDIRPGDVLLGIDLEPVPGGPRAPERKPLLCWKCGGSIFNGHTFHEIERNAKSFAAARTAKDRLDKV